MSQLTFVLYCEYCHEAMALLETALSESGEPLRSLPMSGETLLVVCPFCNGAGHYPKAEVNREDLGAAHDKDKPGSRMVWCTTMRCDVDGCSERFKVLTILDASATKGNAEASVHKARPHILCPAGHDAGSTMTSTERWSD
jgi:hypothetical protein